MDTSPVQSSSKCSSSDFSINRILGGTRSIQEDSRESPSWLCCTRYQPPRLPRASNANGSRARRSGRHARVPFTGAQAAALEAAYARAPYLAPPALRALAAALQLRDDRIKIWFQNRRARERREKNGNITPPRAVTLPPTTVSQLLSPPTLTSTSWSPLETDSNINASQIDFRHRLVDDSKFSLVCDNFKSAYTVSSSNEHNPSLLDTSSEDNRCDTPLDIETIDS